MTRNRKEVEIDICRIDWDTDNILVSYQVDINFHSTSFIMALAIFYDEFWVEMKNQLCIQSEWFYYIFICTHIYRIEEKMNSP